MNLDCLELIMYVVIVRFHDYPRIRQGCHSGICTRDPVLVSPAGKAGVNTFVFLRGNLWRCNLCIFSLLVFRTSQTGAVCVCDVLV